MHKLTIDYSAFPNLTADNHERTSDPASGENCIAHSVGAWGEWWEPIIGRFWPVGPPYYNHRIESLVHVFERMGFAASDSAEFEPEYDKIAIYGDGGEYTHAARQLREDGTWTSKLGPADDIKHATPEALSGGAYGNVAKIMRRRSTGRGLHLRYDDLAAALDASHVCGAFIDVFEEEPLRSDHPAWAHEKIFVTPHVGAMASRRARAVFFAKQIAKFERGETPDGLYEPVRGY